MAPKLHESGWVSFDQNPPEIWSLKVGKLSSQPEHVGPVIVLRRRRTRRHRRNRRIRRVLLLAMCGLLTAGFASVALRYITPSFFRAGRNAEATVRPAEARNLVQLTEQESLRQMKDRPVYPYSVAPGGVRDARELKWITEHDPVVAEHYAGFDYGRAHVVKVVLAREVYVSYRIGSKLYWTRHPIRLKKGETLLTDGSMTARTRCGNRVEEKPQQATSNFEPPAAKFDEPMLPATGTSTASLPAPLQTALLNRPADFGPLSLYDPIEGGNGVPILPPPLPAPQRNLCGVGTKKPVKGEVDVDAFATEIGSGKNKKKVNPCETGGEVPEPSTWLLMISGLAAIYWQARRRFAHNVVG
jgi:hypothetical protein